jgi:hypothetical protein
MERPGPGTGHWHGSRSNGQLRQLVDLRKLVPFWVTTSWSVWKYLPSGKLAGAANRSPAEEPRAWAVAQCASGWPGRGRRRKRKGNSGDGLHNTQAQV